MNWVDDNEFASWLIPEEGISHPLRLVSSSAVAYVGWDEPTEILYVHLLDGTAHAYGLVPFDVYKRFMDAPSKGKFYNWEIKPNFPLIR